MDKEKEIEDMAEVISEENERMFVYHDGYICTPTDQAKTLNNAGYGNIEQAVRGFAEELKKRAKTATVDVDGVGNYKWVIETKVVGVTEIDKLIKERFSK